MIVGFVLGHIRDRKHGLRLVLADKNIYAIDKNTLSDIVAYAPDDTLEDGQWFYLDNFSDEDFCLEFMLDPINEVDYGKISEEELEKLSFLCAFQDDDKLCFQRVTKNQVLHKKRLVFGQIVEFKENSRELIINPLPDAIYSQEEDRLYFKKLSAITAIFTGIDELFKEATEEETKDFLASEFIVLSEGFTSKNVKVSNRKQIALAKQALQSYDEDQKTAVFEQIREYCPSIINDDETFKVSDEDDLQYLLYGLQQRFFTTADGRTKKIASSVRNFGR